MEKQRNITPMNPESAAAFAELQAARPQLVDLRKVMREKKAREAIARADARAKNKAARKARRRGRA